MSSTFTWVVLYLILTFNNVFAIALFCSCGGLVLAPNLSYSVYLGRTCDDFVLVWFLRFPLYLSLTCGDFVACVIVEISLVLVSYLWWLLLVSYLGYPLYLNLPWDVCVDELIQPFLRSFLLGAYLWHCVACETELCSMNSWEGLWWTIFSVVFLWMPYAFHMHFLCTSDALFMHFSKMHAFLLKMHAFLLKMHAFLKSA